MSGPSVPPCPWIAWRLVLLARAYDHNVERVAAHLDWPVYKVQAGLAYAQAFPTEIETAIAENESYDVESLKRLFPQLQVFNVDEQHSRDDTGVGAARNVASAAR